MPDLKTTLTDARTIAVVGCSDRPSRTSYAIARYLQEGRQQPNDYHAAQHHIPAHRYFSTLC